MSKELKKAYTKKASKSSSKKNYFTEAAKKERQLAKTLGIKALRGSAKQKAWAEKIRKNFLQTAMTEEALNFVQNVHTAGHSKFWIDTRNLDDATLEDAMVSLIKATAKANEIGSGNEGYNEQLAIRASALKTLKMS